MPSDNFPPPAAIPLLGAILEYALLDPDEPSLLPDGSSRECLEQALVLWSISRETPDLHYDRDLLNAAKYNIWEKLLSGDLQAWGHNGAPWGPWIKIPADAWFSMRDINWLDGSALHRPSGRVLSGIVITPVPATTVDTAGAPRSDVTPAAELPSLHDKRRGREPEYDWHAFKQEAIRVLEDEGLPRRTNEKGWRYQADLERHMSKWCQDNWSEAPSESMRRKYVVEAIREYKKGREGI
jgi:hypothetical protein